MSVDEAMAESDRIFGSELDDSIDFKRELQISLEQVPLFPKQLALPLADAYGEEVYLNQVTRKPRPPQPKPPAPDPDLYRVEIRRESRRGEKDVRIISL